MARSFAAHRLSWLVMIALDRDRRITDFTVRVATVLADYLNERNGAWPSLETLARVLEASTEGVRIALVKLEGCGYLTAERARGRGKTNVYRMAFPATDKPQQPLVPSVAENPNGDRAMGPTAVGKKPQQPLAQNLKKGTERREPRASLSMQEGFEELWLAYPKRVSKERAWNAYQAVIRSGKVTHDLLIWKAGEFAVRAQSKIARDRSDQYIPHLSTWLTDHGWENELRPDDAHGPKPASGPHSFERLSALHRGGLAAVARRKLERGET